MDSVDIQPSNLRSTTMTPTKRLDIDDTVNIQMTRSAGRWSREEDARLKAAVGQVPNQWAIVSREHVFSRSPHQCRRRWELLSKFHE
jgi:hypothetical protein